METAKVRYTGDLHTEVTHLRSNQTFTTDAPVDNQGKGEAFSPTDLVAVGLGTCVLTIMGIKAQQEGIDMKGAEANIRKIMANKPRRIAEIHVAIKMPNRYFDARQQKICSEAAHNCPVGRSLHPEVVEKIRVDFPG